MIKLIIKVIFLVVGLGMCFLFVIKLVLKEIMIFVDWLLI